MKDRVFIEGIQFHGHHGVMRLERQVGVRLNVDVMLEMDLERSARSDRVADTIDYRAVHQKVLEVGRGKSHRLLESFARVVVGELLRAFPVDRCTVRVRKETPVLDGIVRSVGVEISRSREEAGA